jgi:drug/metabolite transporter (DMT)-like permease
MPRLPAIETSILLLGQPVFAVVWGRMLFAERLSPLQWAGCAVVLIGVGTLRTGD